MYRNILVATDGSRLSAKAVTHAIALARALKATLTAFYASPEYPMPAYADGVAYEPVSPEEYAAACEKEARKILDAVGVKAKAARVKFASTHAIAASPWKAILAAARKQKCDVIVMASHGRSGMSALLLGSETREILAHSKLPLIVVR